MVIIHDENVDRVCNGTGWVKDYTLEELKRFQVSTPEGKKGRIPTLREVLELVKPSGIKVNIELKTGISGIGAGTYGNRRGKASGNGGQDHLFFL